MSGMAGGDKLGAVIVSQTMQRFAAPIGTIVAAGAVATFGTVVGNNQCQVERAGDCQLFRCVGSSSGEEPAPNKLAGAITIMGLSREVVLTPLATSYLSPAYSTWLWTSSRTATLMVAGSADVRPSAWPSRRRIRSR